jgi:hypothetical protein
MPQINSYHVFSPTEYLKNTQNFQAEHQTKNQ